MTANPIKTLREKLRTSMSAKLFAMTVFFILLAEAVVMVPSVSKEHVTWLQARIESAYLVSLALEAPEAEMIDPDTAEQLFATANISGVTVNRGGARFLVFAPEIENRGAEITGGIDLRGYSMFAMIFDAWNCMVSTGDNYLSITGEPVNAEGETVDILVSERALRATLLQYSRNIFLISLLISALTAAFIYRSLDRQIVQPVKRLTQTMAGFEHNPDNFKSTSLLSNREDEIGAAERGLETLQTRIQRLLAERQRLAALGSGISKISHDLRNILASAQLMSDRLAKSDDPRVRKLSPRLISSLDRAISLSNDTVSYGKMGPEVLNKSTVNLHALVAEVFEDAASLHVEFTNRVNENTSVHADKNQLYRAIFNLTRNAVEALSPDPLAPEDEIDAKRPAKLSIVSTMQNQSVLIDIIDNGPGLPKEAKTHLFEPFKGTRKPGGSGLGVAIAYEIMRAHGGNLILLKSDQEGATFRLSLPAAESQ